MCGVACGWRWRRHPRSRRLWLLVHQRWACFPCIRHSRVDRAAAANTDSSSAITQPGSCSITQRLRRRETSVGRSLVLDSGYSAAAHRFRPAATCGDRSAATQSQSSKWPVAARRQAAFPIWRIAFYRHLDDRSAVGPIIDIGRFYRAHAERCTDPLHAVHVQRVRYAVHARTPT